MKLRIACVIVGFLSLVQPTVAQTTAETTSGMPRLVRFGGAVKDLDGNPLTGVVGITFALYSEQTGGAALWLETQNVAADGNGHYVALLGSTKPDGLPTELFTTEQARWVGVQVSGQAEQRRVLLVSAPYALKAGDAETIGGLPPSAFVLSAPVSGGGRMNKGGAPSSPSSSRMAPASSPSSSRMAPASSSDVTTTGGTVNTIPLFTTSTNIQNSILTQTGTTTVSAAGKLTATGIVTGSSFQIGSNLFAFGSYTNANAFLGFAGNSKMTGTDNTASGTTALYSNATGSYNVANGYRALYSNTTGFFNTASGTNALYSNTTGASNMASGNAALYSNTTGGQNTASGNSALYSNTTGSYNVAGGYHTLYFNTTGLNNTANGYQALYKNTTGTSNTANGYNALFSNSTGSNLTCFGYNCSTSVDGLSNSTAIGANAEVAASNALVLGSINGVNGATASTNVGIGTTTPQYTFDVSGTGNFKNTANGTMLMAGNGTRTIVNVSGTPVGFFNGVVLSVSGEGVGASDGSCTPTLGALAVCAYGIGLGSTTGLGPAINAVAGDGAGVQATGYGPVAVGVIGTVNEQGGGVGVIGSASFGFGVQGMAPSGFGSFAGDFEGDVNVSGTLYKSAGSFKIDHPLDPANKYLSHSFVESPDMMNIYNGNAVLDEKGEVWVSLPAWFEVLNRDFRYQLTCVGGFAPIYISEEIKGNRFKIAGGKPGLKVSWQVTGIRQDAYAKARPIVVEQMKPPSEQGFYIFPEGFGQPQSKAIAERYRAKLARLKEMTHRSNEAAPKTR